MSTIPDEEAPRQPGLTLDDTWIEIHPGDLPSGFCPAPLPEARTDVVEDGLSFLGGTGRGTRKRKNARGRKA